MMQSIQAALFTAAAWARDNRLKVGGTALTIFVLLNSQFNFVSPDVANVVVTVASLLGISIVHVAASAAKQDAADAAAHAETAHSRIDDLVRPGRQVPAPSKLRSYGPDDPA